MEQGFLIDSNALIGYLDNKIPADGMVFMDNVINATPQISVITKIEVLRFSAPDAAYKVLEDFVDIAVIYDLDNIIVDQTIKLCRSRKIKLPDAIIAATAIANNLKLITRNIYDFRNIPDLNITDPFNI